MTVLVVRKFRLGHFKNMGEYFSVEVHCLNCAILESRHTTQNIFFKINSCFFLFKNSSAYIFASPELCFFFTNQTVRNCTNPFLLNLANVLVNKT